MKKFWLTLFVSFFFSLTVQCQVRVWQGTLTLPTYEEDLPDPNPPFDQFTTNRFNYPYTLRTNLTSRRANHAWRALYLENEYLKCSVLPDIGGHLYTCVDKLSGQSMFYANPSIKKAAISYRGAWAAFGDEFNFPVSHNWVSMSPVDFAFAQHDDGSASVTVGNVDRVYGMEWSVELVLHPKSTVLEQRVTLSNRSDVRHRFYWWNNAGVQAWDDTQIRYPMRFVATHGFTEVHPWPVDFDGVDYSLLRNHLKGPVSEFTHGSREDFMGLWSPHTNTGTVHYARYEEVPAKKIWSWGADADGLDWRKALSDNDSAYMEVQAGLFRNQETYAFLEPRQVIRFSEYWMPVREIGGISRANLAGVASLTRNSNNLVAGLNANQPISQASVSLLNGAQVLFHEKVDLAPEHSWVHELPNADPQAKYTIEVKDAKGTTLLRQTEGKYDWAPESEIHLGPQPSHALPEPDKRNYDDWMQSAKDDELNGRILNAFDSYKEVLAKYPDSFEAAKRAGRVAATLLRYQEARDLLEPLHARDTSDTEISYYLGLAYDGLEDEAHARSSYEQAERLPTFYTPAAVRLGELLARQGDLHGAGQHFSNAMQSDPQDVRIREEFVAVTNAAGDSQKARELAKASLSQFPLSDFLREEVGNPNLAHLADDSDRVLNIASEYMRLGLYQRALSILTRQYPPAVADEAEPGALAPRNHPMVAYFRAYCREKLGQSSAEDYTAASKLSTAFVFPSTAEERTVLKSAVAARPSDGSAHYLLGTLYFSRGLTDAALAEWAEARKSGATIPVLSASTGLALLHIKNDPEKALSAFREGLQSDPTNIAIYMGIDQALSLMNSPARERVEALEKYPKLNSAPPSLVFELILNLAEAGDFDRAQSLFHNRFFAREEGGTNVRQVWIEVQLQQIAALAKSGHCDQAMNEAARLGAPVSDLAFTHDGLEPFLQSARTRYLLGSAYAACGKASEATSNFQSAAQASAPDQVHWAWLAAQKLPSFNASEWRTRLQQSFEQAAGRSDTSGYPSWWMYTAGLLAESLSNTHEAAERYRNALLLPDRMLAYHYTRLAKSGTTP